MNADVRAAASKARLANLGPLAEAAAIAAVSPGALWEDPTKNKPLIGDNLTIAHCKPLSADGL